MSRSLQTPGHVPARLCRIERAPPSLDAPTSSPGAVATCHATAYALWPQPFGSTRNARPHQLRPNASRESMEANPDCPQAFQCGARPAAQLQSLLTADTDRCELQNSIKA